MIERRHDGSSGAVILGAIIVLPLLGAWTVGRDLRAVFSFPPPLRIPTEYPRFSWFAVALVLSPFVALGIRWLLSCHKIANDAPAIPDRDFSSDTGLSAFLRPLPSWGWIAGGWTLVWWILAWTRLAWFAPLQRYTFFPLWIGFIVVTNAVTMSRHGTCLMARCPRRWLALFVASAGFWWVFEWLNRFAQNWHYLAVSDFSPIAYACHATLCFSTVLPAVAGVAELLWGWPRLRHASASGPDLRWLAFRPTAIVLLVGGGGGLFGTGAQPHLFYPALWAAPLALLVGFDVLAHRGELAARVAQGDWRRAASWALAALICGVFWELWNARSATKWIYTVPYVDRWHVFEMPFLGYLGYLPFGLECAYVAARVFGDEWPFSSASST